MTVLAAPALPLHTAGKYVAAAYIVFFAIILIYVAIMATRLNRIDREVDELLERFPAAPPHPELARPGPDSVEEAPLPEESARV
jgi:CcmD family protein